MYLYSAERYSKTFRLVKHWSRQMLQRLCLADSCISWCWTDPCKVCGRGNGHVRPVVGDVLWYVSDWNSSGLNKNVSSLVRVCRKSTFCWRENNKPSTVSRTRCSVVGHSSHHCCCSKVLPVSERVISMSRSLFTQDENIFNTFPVGVLF